MSASLINRAECRRKLIQWAQGSRYYWGQVVGDGVRVSEATLDNLEALVDAKIRDIVAKLPSKGKTI
jgi:hypothetical protein